MAEKLLLFGGSFDPVHNGHLIIARAAAEAVGVGRVVLIPSPHPPHKPDRELAPGPDRLEMCRRAVAGDPQFSVSDWELGQPGPSYTWRTVRHFRQVCPAGTEICWLIGADSLVELGTWYRVGELVELCTIVSAGRPGFETPDLSVLEGPLTRAQIERLRRQIVATPLIEISATDIRARVRAGRSIRYLVPDAVAAHIAERGLYRAS